MVITAIFKKYGRIVPNVPLLWGILIMGAAMHVWRLGVYRKSLSFAINKKLL